MTRQAAARRVMPHLSKLYALMHEHITNDPPAATKVRTYLQNKRGWVWVGARFAYPHQVALESAISARPYLFTLPPDLAPFSPTLVTLGVRRTFGPEDWAAALAAMAKAQGTTPLTSHQLDLAVALVQKVSDGGEQVGRDAEVMAPDENGVMRPAAEMVYDDVPWMSAEAKSASGHHILVHQKLSSAVADKVRDAFSLALSCRTSNNGCVRVDRWG